MSPTVHQLRPLPSEGGPGAGLVFPGGVEVLLSDAESFGGEGCTLLLFAPRDPREVRLGFISRSALPTPLAALGVTSLKYADLFTLTLFPRGLGDLGEAVAAGWGDPFAAPAPPARDPPANGPCLPPCPAGCCGNRTGLLMSPGLLLRDRSARPSPCEVTVAMATAGAARGMRGLPRGRRGGPGPGAAELPPTYPRAGGGHEGGEGGVLSREQQKLLIKRVKKGK